ncbi:MULTISPECIES: hypothetical protein [Legionella]|uniref:Transmembrane protein n=1 Tax=Legionella resiliens TaxID=2905958 RepID=A0ABS8X727_9GAMM|nr:MULTISPECIES: hypothetical protein [unclassified Legionella]MCE0724189.1 hypothetical protein [Legionella sp. 9fVS26]MCE3533342.1 hypothetical protein [Legionella sp. 8cVS16]QLZ69528.1 hypothetical protein FOLKNPGA_02322 [Legionella sp. PC1000]
MKHFLLKFGLFGSGIGGSVGLGLGAYYGGVLGATAGAACGLALGPAALLITSMAIGLACLTAAAVVAVPCFLGYLLMREILLTCAVGTRETLSCCLG